MSDKSAAAYGINEHGEKCTYQVEAMKVGYRYGYCVVGSAPRYIGITEDPVKAERLAKDSAGTVRAQLDELGAHATKVDWWVQRRAQVTEYRYDDPESGPVTA